MTSPFVFGRRSHFGAILLLWSFSLYLPAATPSPIWRWSNPSPHGNNIVEMISTNGFAVQVCDRGQLYSSVDYETWVPHETHTSNALRCLCFFKGQFVVSAEGGTILTGDTNFNFKVVSLGTTDWLEGITSSTSLLVAVGDNGAIYTSTDAASWNRQAVPFNNWLRSVTFGTPGGQPLFVAVGEQGLIATSSNGIQWKPLSPPTVEDLNRVTWLNGEFLAAGEAGVVFASTDGKAWSAISTGATSSLNAIIGTSNSTLISGDLEMRLQEGRNAWTDELALTNSFSAPPWTYLSGFHDGTSYLVGGRTGVLVEGFKTNATSQTFWLPFDSSLRSWLWDVKHFPNLYITVGDQATVMSSLDGIVWAQELVPDAAANSVLLGIGGWTNLAVAVGSGGTIIVSHDTLVDIVSTNLDGSLVTNQVSTLGIVWTAVQPPPTTNDLQGITASGSLLVASGAAGTILTSADGTSWEKRTTPAASFLSSVETSSSGLVAVGKQGTILTSPDALSWTKRMSNTTNWIYRVRRLADRWVAVGQNGTILTSSDGAAWTQQISGTTRWLNDVILIGSTYFAIGTQGTVLASSDAVNWSDIGTITGKSLYGAASSEGQLVTVGVEGVILRGQVTPVSTPVTFLRYPKNAGQNLFLFGGRPDQSFALDRSNDLRNWLLGPTLELDSTGTLLYIDNGINAPNVQFYRTRPPP